MFFIQHANWKWSTHFELTKYTTLSRPRGSVKRCMLWVFSRNWLCYIEAALYCFLPHYSDVIMSTMESQITSITIVYSTVYQGADERKHQSSALLTFVKGIHRWPVNSPHKRPVTRKTFTFDDVIMESPQISASGERMYHDAYTIQKVEMENLTDVYFVIGTVPFLLNLIQDVSDVIGISLRV